MMSSHTKKNIDLKSHLLVQIAVLFKFSTFFQQCFKVLTQKYAFPTATKIYIFFKFILSNLGFSYAIIENKLLISTMGCWNIKLS